MPSRPDNAKRVTSTVETTFATSSVAFALFFVASHTEPRSGMIHERSSGYSAGRFLHARGVSDLGVTLTPKEGSQGGM